MVELLFNLKKNTERRTHRVCNKSNNHQELRLFFTRSDPPWNRGSMFCSGLTIAAEGCFAVFGRADEKCNNMPLTTTFEDKRQLREIVHQLICLLGQYEWLINCYISVSGVRYGEKPYGWAIIYVITGYLTNGLDTSRLKRACWIYGVFITLAGTWTSKMQAVKEICSM